MRSSFNPRARVGRDLQSPQLQALLDSVSIHAPAWGATGVSQFIVERIPSFNPRARVGRDSTDCQERHNVVSFNPRARVGRDTGAMSADEALRSFNPRARVGRDLNR